MTSTYRVLDRDAYHDERLTLSKDIEEAIDREVIQYVPLMGELETSASPRPVACCSSVNRARARR